MRGRRYVTAGVGVLLAGALCTACSSGGNGLAGETPAQILSATQTALQSAYSATLDGHVQSGTTQLVFDLQVFRSGATDGTWSTGATSSGTLSTARIVIVDSGVFLRGPALFWEGFFSLGGVTLPPRDAAKLAGHWIRLNESADPDFSSFALPAFVQSVKKVHPKGFTKVGTKTIDGVHAVGIRDPSFGTLWVATSGAADPVLLVHANSSGSGTISFSNWGKGSPPTEPVRSTPLKQALHS